MRGLTLIEIILVVAIIAVIGTMSAPFISRFYLQSNLDTSSQMLVSSIRKAQGYSMDGKGGSAWGICQSGNAIRIFQGTCGAPTFNEDYTIPPSVTLSGLSTVTFSVTRGEPSATFTATLNSQIGSHTVQINTAGVLTIN